MKQFDFIVKVPSGIHARPATMVVQEAKKVTSIVKLGFRGRKVNARSIMDVLSLHVCVNDQVSVYVEGVNEEEDVLQIKTFFENNL